MQAFPLKRNVVYKTHTTACDSRPLFHIFYQKLDQLAPHHLHCFFFTDVEWTFEYCDWPIYGPPLSTPSHSAPWQWKRTLNMVRGHKKHWRISRFRCYGSGFIVHLLSTYVYHVYTGCVAKYLRYCLLQILKVKARCALIKLDCLANSQLLLPS